MRRFREIETSWSRSTSTETSDRVKVPTTPTVKGEPIQVDYTLSLGSSGVMGLV
ncbi:MAG: hypothetical protein HYV07_12555 [Deltaproteobacteria bacterium]|nr:hypothetical protein [Deltaproteobacteria bacterium]